MIETERNTFTEGSREEATRQCLAALRTAGCSGTGGSEDRFHKKAPEYVGTCRIQQGLYRHVLEGYEQRTDMTSALKCSCGLRQWGCSIGNSPRPDGLGMKKPGIKPDSLNIADNEDY